MAEFGPKIRQLRLKHGWTEEQVASAIKGRQKTVSLLENGNAQPTLKYVRGLAALFEVPISYLLDDREHTPSEEPAPDWCV